MKENYAALRRLPTVLTESDEAVLEALYERMPAGRTSKRTWRNRLTVLDDILIGEINNRFAGAISVHDMAASSAITSMELYQRLRTNRTTTLRASDYYDAAFFVGPIAFDVDGHPMRRNLLSVLARGIHRLGLAQRISLFHPAARALAERDAGFVLAKEDFFSPLLGRYDVVRVMNALTEFNFPRDRIEAALRAIVPTVKDGGLLVLGRCDDADNHIQATIFAKESGEFSVLCQVGEGYPLTSAVVPAVA